MSLRISYDTIEEFNMDLKAECGQLNLAHLARNKNETYADGHLVRYRLSSVKAVRKESERLWRKNVSSN